MIGAAFVQSLCRSTAEGIGRAFGSTLFLRLFPTDSAEAEISDCWVSSSASLNLYHILRTGKGQKKLL